MVPTAVGEDSIRDAKLTYDEIRKMIPQFKPVTDTSKSTSFNHQMFSI